MSGAQQDIEDRLTAGILGQWYVVGKSVQVQPGRPHAVRALGRNLVPHRDAPLSRGEVHDGDIACRYHGVARMRRIMTRQVRDQLAAETAAGNRAAG